MSKPLRLASSEKQIPQDVENIEKGEQRMALLEPGTGLRSRVTTIIKTCRSERKAEDNQQVVSNADQLLAPSLSALSSRFATICHNYYYVFMTANPSMESGPHQ